jgi:exopolysaccharide biosynthesis polyprenyl glycosylphosphotransferase
MIISRSSRFPRKKFALATADAMAAAVAIVVAVFLRLGWLGGYEYLQERWVPLVVAWLAFGLAFYISGIYESDRLQNIGRMAASALLAVALGGFFLTAFFYATLQPGIGRGIFLGFAAFVLVAVVLLRILYMVAMRRGFLSQRCLIIGSNGEAQKIVDLIQKHPQAGIRVLGLIQVSHDREHIGKFIGNYPILGNLDALEKFVDLYNVERLILAIAANDEPILLKRLRPFRYRGLAMVDFVTLHEELAQLIPLEHINDEWLFIASMNNSRFHIRRVKRLVDILVSLVVAIVTLPVMAVTALLIRLTSPGPILYRQERLGRDSAPFTLLKFRTMRADAETQTGPVWAAEDDPRITGLGKWLRKFRIDELPQLVNVLNGEMSLVGPRPEREVFIRKLAEKVPFYAERLLVPPGVTGWAQVMYPYAASIEESRFKLQYDLYYIKHMSFFLDLYVVLKTFKTILFGRERPAAKLSAPDKPKPVELDTQMLYFQSPPPAANDAPAKPHAHDAG